MQTKVGLLNAAIQVHEMEMLTVWVGQIRLMSALYELNVSYERLIHILRDNNQPPQSMREEVRERHRGVSLTSVEGIALTSIAGKLLTPRATIEDMIKNIRHGRRQGRTLRMLRDHFGIGVRAVLAETAWKNMYTHPLCVKRGA